MKLTVQVTGQRGVVASFDNLFDGAVEAVQREVQTSLANIERGAKSRVHVSNKAHVHLRDTIRTETAKGGLYGYVQAGYGKLRRRSGSKSGRRADADQKQPGIYAPVVEFKFKLAFLLPAWRIEKSPFDDRLRVSLANAAQKAMTGTGTSS